MDKLSKVEKILIIIIVIALFFTFFAVYLSKESKAKNQANKENNYDSTENIKDEEKKEDTIEVIKKEKEKDEKYENKNFDIPIIAENNDGSIKVIFQNGSTKDINGINGHVYYLYSNFPGNLYVMDEESGFLTEINSKGDEVIIQKFMDSKGEFWDERDGNLAFLDSSGNLFLHDGQGAPNPIDSNVIRFFLYNNDSLAYVKNDSSGENTSLYYRDLKKEENIKIDNNIEYYSYPRVSSNRKFIAYLRSDGLYIKNLENDLKLKLGEAKQVLDMYVDNEGNAVYISTTNDNSSGELYMQKFDGEIMQISSGVNSFKFIDKYIYFQTDENKLYCINLDDIKPEKLLDDVESINKLEDSLYVKCKDILYKINNKKLDEFNNNIKEIWSDFDNKEDNIIYTNKNKELYIGKEKIAQSVEYFAVNEGQVAYIDSKNKLYIYKNGKGKEISIDTSKYKIISFGNSFLVNSEKIKREANLSKLDGVWKGDNEYLVIDGNVMELNDFNNVKKSEFSMKDLGNNIFSMDTTLFDGNDITVQIINDNKILFQYKYKDVDGKMRKVQRNFEKSTIEDMNADISKIEKLSKIAKSKIKEPIEFSYITIDNGKKYYHFASPYYAKVGIIVDENGKCYDFVTYNFRTIYEEIK